MAADGWRGDASVKDRLFSEGHRFDFYKAVALVEAIAVAQAKAEARPEPTSVGEGSDPRREAVHFGAAVGFGFPPGDVVAVLPPRARGDAAGADDAHARHAAPNPGPAEQAYISVAFLSLVGGLGPMPEPIADMVQRSTVTRDLGPADFLDIFHHRLVSLRYRIKKHHRPALAGVAPETTRVAEHLFALIGLYQPPLRRPLHDLGRGLLHYAGLLGSEVRSMAGLTAVLRHRFGFPVESVPLTGCFRHLDPADCTRIGPSGNNRRLGDSAALGRRAWDQAGAFELKIGPLTNAELHRFLPGGDGVAPGDVLAPFAEVVRFYAGPTVLFTLRLGLKPGEAPQAALGREGRMAPVAPMSHRRRHRHHAPRAGTSPRLGFSAWLGKGRPDPSALEVRIPSTEIP